MGFLKSLGEFFVDWSTGGDNDRNRTKMAQLEADRDAFFEQARREKEAKEAAKSGWGPRTHGSVDGTHDATFREGTGANEGDVLISDGHLSSREFDRDHNHYGDKREGGGRIEDDDGDRGKYKGPGK